MKTYITPCLEIHQAAPTQVIAVSIIDGEADGSGEVLSKEDNSWQIWQNDAVSPDVR